MEARALRDYYTAEDYYNTPENVRLELIDGVFYDMAPPSRKHQEIVASLCTLISNYIKGKNGDCKVYPGPFGVQLSENEDTVVEPDLTVICDKDKLTDRGCTGAPDWIIEVVSPNDPGHDYITKLNLYIKAGVREYWIVDPANGSVTVYVHSGEKNEPSHYSFSDTIKVSIYEDFSIDFSEISRNL